MNTLLLLFLLNPFTQPNSIQRTNNASIYQNTQVRQKTLTYCYITGTNVRMRETPSLQGRIVSTFRYYEGVEVIRWSNDSNWCRVRRSNGMTGWVFGDFVGDCEEGDR